MSLSHQEIRDRTSPSVRRKILDRMGVVPFPHQAAWWIAADGHDFGNLLDTFPASESPRDTLPLDAIDTLVSRLRLIEPDGTPHIIQARHLPAYLDRIFPDKTVAASSDEKVDPPKAWHIDPSMPEPIIERHQLVPRHVTDPEDRRATELALLAAYKGAKSSGAGWFVAAELVAPGVIWELVGMEYGICGPEFEYIASALFSEAGLNIPLMRQGQPPEGHAFWGQVQNNPRKGVMEIKLSNGSRLTCRSWERSEAMKGKEVDGYLFAEYYQFPGIKVYHDVKQNLIARSGKAIFPTTPDAPHVSDLHDFGHGEKDTRVCICGVTRAENPFTFRPKEMARDRREMTRESFQISYLGKMEAYIGSVFHYHRGERVFDARSHPELWQAHARAKSRDQLSAEDLDLDQFSYYEIVGGGDTGGEAYCAAFGAFDPEGNAFMLFEIPNYEYASGNLERLDWMSLDEWYERIRHVASFLGARPNLYADRNTQFRHDARDHGVSLFPGADPELRTEVARSYFQHDRIHFAPWLEIIPFETERAVFPPEESSTGRWKRVKRNDHGLDCMEHILAQRREGKVAREPRRTLAIESIIGQRMSPPRDRFDPHFGG